MKAKDTVMNHGEIRDAVALSFYGKTSDSPYQCVANAQAIITWGKATKEVVDWIVANDYSWPITYDEDWEAKLKEWGYEKERDADSLL